MAAAASSHIAKPKSFGQDQLNDLVRDLGLSKESSDILASRLGEYGTLGSGAKITFYSDRDDFLIRFSLWKMTSFIATTSKGPSTTQVNADVCHFIMATSLHVFQSDIQ